MEKESTTKTILIPTDFSEVCNNAVNHGLDLARDFDFNVVVLHVVNKDTKAYLQKEKIELSELENKLIGFVKEQKTKHNLDVRYLLKSGNIFDEIATAASEVNAALIILGTHGKVGFQRLTGSYALKVISSTNVPTIVVQKRLVRSGYKNIVFPITNSTKDRQKVNWAIAIANTFDATIHIFPKYESEKYYKGRIMSIVKQIKNIFEEKGVKHVDKVSEEEGGNFAKQVIDYSVENDADLIMIMTSDNQALPMFDSWDEQIIFNSSQIPVICINPVHLEIARFGWY